MTIQSKIEAFLEGAEKDFLHYQPFTDERERVEVLEIHHGVPPSTLHLRDLHLEGIIERVTEQGRGGASGDWEVSHKVGCQIE